MKKLILILSVFITSLFSQDSIPEYERGFYRHWNGGDIKENCFNTRQEVLIEEALSTIVIDSAHCTVLYAIWYDWYSGSFIFEASELDVDHFIPLKNAHISGAWKWSKEKKEKYANYLEDENHLMAVLASENRSKGSRSPDQWLPSNEKFHVTYCKIWVDIKYKWELSVTRKEYDKLKEILGDYYYLEMLKIRD